MARILMVWKSGVIASCTVVHLWLRGKCHVKQQVCVCTASVCAVALCCGNMQHVEVGAAIENMSCCSLCDAEDLMKLEFIPDLAKSRWRLSYVSFPE